MEQKDLIDNAIYIHSYSDIYSDVNILSAGFEITTKEKPVRKWDDFLEFSFHCVTNGKGYYKINNKEYSIKKNTIFVLFPNTPLEYYPDKDTPWTYYWINFTGSKVLKLLTRIGATPENPILNFTDSHIIKYFTGTILKCKNNPENADLISLANFYKIISALTPKTLNSFSEYRKYSDLALEYISQNYLNPNLTIQSVSTHLNISSPYLTRILKKETGMSFSEHLIRIRIKAADSIINNNPQASVTEIATQVGFFDPYYFSKVFKKYNNITPSALIKELRQKKAFEAHKDE